MLGFLSLLILWSRSCLAVAKCSVGSKLDSPLEMMGSTVDLTKGTVGSIVIVDVAESVG